MTRPATTVCVCEQIRRLEQLMRKEEETGRMANGDPPPASRQYKATNELLARASAASVVHISVAHDAEKGEVDLEARLKKQQVFGMAKK